jgi:hypothetical protein
MRRKATLEIDLPEGCFECPCYESMSGLDGKPRMHHCRAEAIYWIEHGHQLQRPGHCPIDASCVNCGASNRPDDPCVCEGAKCR